MKRLASHSDYTETPPAGARGWEILQIISPIDSTNKGTALRDIIGKLGSDVRVVHFGDSSTDHTSDTVVGAELPSSIYVEIHWEDGVEVTEELLVTNIKKYL